jgi:hypothetical protein
MLNELDDRGVDQRRRGERQAETSQWCVGEPPLRWDVPFGARLAEKLKQIFWRDAGERELPSNTMRKAA